MDDKVTFVTAGSSGMGAAAARRLAADGIKVAIPCLGREDALADGLGDFGVTESNQSADDLKRLVDHTVERWGPLGRYGKAEEVAATITFLTSEGAVCITGQHLRVDGGVTGGG